MSSVTEDPDAAELHALRRRAYGPAPDITDDPDALARLRELEDRHRDGGREARPQRGPAEVEAVTRPARTDHAEPAPAASVFEPAPVADPDAAATPPAPATPRRWPRWWPLAWATSLLVAVIAGYVLAAVVGDTRGGIVATLAPDPDADWPQQQLPSDNGVSFEVFHGLLAAGVAQDFDEELAQECLYILGAEDQSFQAANCGTGRFPISTSVLVTAQSPDALREEFADGTSLQFVLDGDRVTVFARRGPVPTSTP